MEKVPKRSSLIVQSALIVVRGGGSDMG